MLHHIVKDFKEICPYCGNKIEEKENVHHFKHNYVSMKCPCGKNVMKKNPEPRMSKFIKTSKDR